MPIPKVIYQTWKTKYLPKKVNLVRYNIHKLNPEYTIFLYDDNDIDNFIKDNFDEKIYNSFKKLKVGAAKADFWRYCVLYKNGGVYLDVDSNILKPLNQLIKPDDKCIITRENNKGVFNNWFMIFDKEHPILWNTIQKCCYNIDNKTTNDVCKLTGPEGPFTDAINETLQPLCSINKNLYFESDKKLNKLFNNKNNNEYQSRFYGIDMGSFGQFKHVHNSELYKNTIPWRYDKNVFI